MQAQARAPVLEDSSVLDQDDVVDDPDRPPVGLDDLSPEEVSQAHDPPRGCGR